MGTKLVTCVSWAPSCGRDFHLIATGSRDGVVTIWKVTTGEGQGGAEDGVWDAKVVAELKDHG
jgi:nucleoporin SEH1